MCVFGLVCAITVVEIERGVKGEGVEGSNV